MTTTKTKKTFIEQHGARWIVHTPNMLKEVLTNNQAKIFSIPFNVFGKILNNVGVRASQLNDPVLNDLMCQLTIYSIADPESPDYNQEALQEIRLQAIEQLEKERKEKRTISN